MSGIATAIVAAAVIGAGTAVYTSDVSRKASHSAQDQAEATALRQEQQAEEASNKANRRTPDVSAIMSAAQQAGKGGISGTMLTGSTGVSASDLVLGKNTLLGG